MGSAFATKPLLRTAYLFVALVLVAGLNRRQGIATATTLTAFVIGVPAGLIGARLLDVFEQWGHYQSLRDLVGPHGSSIYGALFAALAVGFVYGAAKGISPLKLLDAGAPAMALGEAVTRVGCFLNGCCYGVPWTGPLVVAFPPESFAYRDQLARGLLSPTAATSLSVHPIQLYTAGVAFLTFLLLLRLFLRPHREGSVCFAFLIAYGALRLGTAPLRQEALASMKVFSALFIAVGAVGLLARQRRPTIVPTAVLSGDLRSRTVR